jgi:hypothetical protein
MTSRNRPTTTGALCPASVRPLSCSWEWGNDLRNFLRQWSDTVLGGSSLACLEPPSTLHACIYVGGRIITT